MLSPTKMSKTSSPANASTKKKSSPVRPEIVYWWTKQAFGPIEDFFIRCKVSPNQISLLGLALCFVGSVFFATGFFILGAWFLAFSASFDFLDGSVARKTGQSSPAGSFLDSILDRYADSAIFFALAVFFRDSWVLWLVIVAWAGSLLTSYVRAKAEAVGVSGKEGWMQRPERLIILLVGALFSGLWEPLYRGPLHGDSEIAAFFPLILGLLIIAFFSHLVALTRLRSGMRQLAQGPSKP